MARTSAKNLKHSSKLSKPKAKPSETPKPPSPLVVEVPASTGAGAEPSDEDSEDSEDDGVDDEGMSKLMKLLGNDGLDEIAEQQLSELGRGDDVNTARSKSAAAKLPFSRPSDYFAEMVKSDSHMERIRQRLLDERAGIQKSEVAKKQRELKKIGKQVQFEKLKEREKGKKEMNERVKGLKRKRGGALDATEDSEAFDVAVEDAIADRPAKRGKQSGKPNMNRTKRDAKFGFGGAGTKGRRAKQNTKQSTESFDFRGGMGRERRGGNNGGKRGASKRPGKSRRQAGRA
ncbi:hypothetical protein RSAG8_07272, partial [Rhizoctonia solani AG-8 WAC10335]